MSGVSAKIDSKGRLMIPREVREELGLQPGTVVYMKADGEELRMAKAGNPFEELAAVAVEEYRRGRTKTLRDIKRDEGLD